MTDETREPSKEAMEAAAAVVAVLTSDRPPPRWNIVVARAIDAAVKAEREDCARALEDHADKLVKFMETFPVGDPNRSHISRRAGEWYEAKATIRARTP